MRTSWKGVFLLVLLPALARAALTEESPPDPPPDPPPVDRPADPVELPDIPGLNLPGVRPPWAKGPKPDAPADTEIQLVTATEEPRWGEAVELIGNDMI